MTKSEQKFSVVMTVFDNAKELEENLPVFLTQVYEPGYEVIVVDESSTDNTDDVLKLHKHNHSHLYTTFLPRPNRNASRRKLALTIGVKAAKNEWIIFTDIHSAPPSREWLKELVPFIENSTEAIIGYFGKKGTRLQVYEDISQPRQLIRKTERIHVDGHRGKRLRFLRGKYDFILVRSDKAHNILKYFEQNIQFHQLMWLRLSVMFNNLI